MSRLFRMTVQDSMLDIIFYDNGNNLIPVNSLTKKPKGKWEQLQEESMSIELYERQKKNGDYDNGYGIITGRIRRGPYKDKNLVCIDIDNKKGIDTFLSHFSQFKTIDQLAQNTLVVQHEDAKEEKVHIYFITETPITKRSGIRSVGRDIEGIDEEETPKIEIKSDSSTYVVGPGSMHKNGHPYEIVGLSKPRVLNKEQSEQLETAINDIYEKYGNKNKNNQNGLIPISELFKVDFTIDKGNNRQEAVLRVCESLIQRLRGTYSIDKIREMAYEWNKEHCIPPLDDKEFESKWESALKFVGKSKPEDNENPEKENSELDYLNNIRQRYHSIFYDQLNKLYVTIKINDHIENISIESKRFKFLVRKEILEKEGKTISDDKLDMMIKSIQAEMMFDENIERKELSLRVAGKDNNTIYYDLTNQKWEIVKITSGGWEILKNNTIPLFKRYETNIKPQVYPIKDQKNEEYFKKFLKMFNLRTEKDLLLLSVYVISLFIPEIPKVILVISGNGGGAKTTTFSLIKNIVDPSSLDTLSFSPNKNDLIQSLEHHYVIYYDNVSYISPQVSDILCRAVTGSGNSKRELYTTDEDFIYQFKRCIGINGINIVTTRPDLADRSLMLKVERIPEKKRRKEEIIKEEFKRLSPFVLGYIFEMLVKVLKYKEEHKDEAILLNFPRMADFAEWCEISSRCMGNPDNAFINAYQENIDNQNDEIIESNPVAETVITFMENKDKWVGTPTELYRLFCDIIDQVNYNIKRTNYWPKTPTILTRRLNEITPHLLMRGIEIVTGEKNNKGNRVIRVENIKHKDSIAKNREDAGDDINEKSCSSSCVNLYIHRIGNSDRFECEICRYRDDIHAMKQHNHDIF